MFDDDRYFDVFVEYAKAAPEDLLIRIFAVNRGREAAHLHLLPTLWFRNTWSWSNGAAKPSVRHLGAAFHEYLISQRKDAVNAAQTGTKAAAHYELDVPAGKTVAIRLRLIDTAPRSTPALFGTVFDEIFDVRVREADDFYRSITPDSLSADEARVMRQALAGMLWSKQYYSFDARF